MRLRANDHFAKQTQGFYRETSAENTCPRFAPLNVGQRLSGMCLTAQTIDTPFTFSLP
jgi:hypothetical protein